MNSVAYSILYLQFIAASFIWKMGLRKSRWLASQNPTRCARAWSARRETCVAERASLATRSVRALLMAVEISLRQRYPCWGGGATRVGVGRPE